MTDDPEAGRLRWLLLQAGVGSKWSNRELERRAGYNPDGTPVMGYQTWRRVMEPIPPGESGYNLSPRQLRIMTDTLRQAGARVAWDEEGENPQPPSRENPGEPLTQGHLTRAWAADFGHVGYESVTHSDDVEDMINRLPGMDPDGLAKIEAALESLRAAQNPRRSRDEREDMRPRSE